MAVNDNWMGECTVKNEHISEAVIRRLPKYLRQLRDLKLRGIERISSGELSKEMGINASQIRQDLNCFGGFGQQGYGYQVDVLLNEVANILGIVNVYQTIIVGVGNIGAALLQYTGFKKDGFEIVAAFDNDPKLVGSTIAGKEIYDIKGVEAFIQENGIDVAIIATPRAYAQKICDLAVKGGVKGIWNFAPIDVNANCHVENVHLSDGLRVLSYRLTNG